MTEMFYYIMTKAEWENSQSHDLGMTEYIVRNSGKPLTAAQLEEVNTLDGVKIDVYMNQNTVYCVWVYGNTGTKGQLKYGEIMYILK